MFERATAIRKIDERDLLDEFEAGQLAVDFDYATPQEVIACALERWGSAGRPLYEFPGRGHGHSRHGVADRQPTSASSPWTPGACHQETYDVMEEVRQRYGINVEVYFPDAKQVEKMVSRLGPNLFQKSVEARLTCCNVRKVEPIRGVLEGLDAWVTGLRRDQWASRANIRKVEIDHDHGGLAKINPLADWTLEEVKEYNLAHGVPEHPLYAKGYTSIGCAPCTRVTAPGEDPRAGRWWWEKNAPKECGIHCPIETGAFEHELESLVQLRPKPLRVV